MGISGNAILLHRWKNRLYLLALEKKLHLSPFITTMSTPEQKPVQPKLTMILICWFLGAFGVHRYMMGYSNWWLMLITLGGCGIWSLIDLIQIATGNMKMADGRELTA
jgi:hypothetical protein